MSLQSFSLLALDPGVKAVGWAGFGPTGRLAGAGVSIVTGRPKDLNATLARHSIPQASRAVVERMRWRPNDARSQPNDLLDVQFIGVALAAASASQVLGLYASEWKGSVPKAIHHPRILKALTSSERHVVVLSLDKIKKSVHKEAIDAIGIGLFYVGRIDRAGRKRTES